MGMESDAASVNYELQRLRRSVRTAKLLTLLLAFIVLALFIAIAAVGVSQAKKISNLNSLAHAQSVILGSGQSSLRNKADVTYGGSLFRGSGFWATKLPLPGPLADHSSVGVNESVYILGGQDKNGTVLDQVLKYDPVLHTYTQMAKMPGPRYRMGVTLLDNGKQDTIYVVGGRLNENVTVRDLYVYNIPTNTWTVAPAAPINASDNCAGSVGGKVYLIGGYDVDYKIPPANYEYDPAKNTWTQKPDMPTPRGDLMCVNFMGEVYALGGYYDPNFAANAFSDKVESFNPATNKWTIRPHMLTPRGDAGATVLPGNRIMVIGGEGHYRNNEQYKYPKHVNEVYYADDGIWVQKAFIPTARFRTTAASSGGLAYVFGGSDLCIDMKTCPSLNTNEVFLDVDHPHVYVYLKNQAYNDSLPQTIYPL